MLLQCLSIDSVTLISTLCHCYLLTYLLTYLLVVALRCQVPCSVWRLILLNVFYIRAAMTSLLLSGTSAVPVSRRLNCTATSKSVCLQHTSQIAVCLFVLRRLNNTHIYITFCHTMLCISTAVPSCGVCVSDTFVYHVKTNKHIFKMFSPSGSHTILLFSYQRGCRYSDRNPPNGGFKCKGYEKIPLFDRYFHQYLALSQKRF